MPQAVAGKEKEARRKSEEGKEKEARRKEEARSRAGARTAARERTRAAERTPAVPAAAEEGKEAAEGKTRCRSCSSVLSSTCAADESVLSCRSQFTVRSRSLGAFARGDLPLVQFARFDRAPPIYTIPGPSCQTGTSRNPGMPGRRALLDRA